jgi:FSR family fosmidomycin resistance protein-like MFS transporter
MQTPAVEPIIENSTPVVNNTVLPILLALSFSHLLNDTIQSLIPAIYPMVKESFQLSFAQIGLITLTFQLTASLLQPLVGIYVDRRPQPYALAVGMGVTLTGLVLLAFAHHFLMIIGSVALVGVGSSIFHPEASRLAHTAAGRRRGFAQSLFQVGGNLGSSLGPLLAALIIVPNGQFSIIWFSLAAFLAIAILTLIGNWYKNNIHRIKPKNIVKQTDAAPFSKKKVVFAIGILLILIFSKYFYLVSMSNYYTFYLMDKFGVSVEQSQVYLFVFLFAVALGTLVGGPVGDRIGRKYVIWFSILGVAPFSLLLPYSNLFVTSVLTVFIGLILSSAFSAILVYAQELMPGKVGMVAGLFFGLAFGMGGVASAVLGKLADLEGIQFVYRVCAFLPLIGIVAALLPEVEGRKSLRFKV